MKTTSKILLTVGMLGILGLGGVARSVYANQAKPSAAVISQHPTSTPNQTTKPSDGDGEANDATESPEQVKPHQTQENDENEANEGANDKDSGSREDAQ